MNYSPKKFDNSLVQQARDVNIVDFLTNRGILLKREGKNYHPIEHDSLKINSKGYVWNSKGTKGNALDFVQDYFGLSFVDAVKELTGIKNNGSITTTAVIAPMEKKEHVLTITKADNVKRAYAYLTKTRGISKETMKMCLTNHLISQDLNGNIVFRWWKNGEIVGANLKGTSTKSYNEITRSNEGKDCGFIVKIGRNPQKAIVFESPIDLLSFIDLYKDKVDNRYLLSMSGLKQEVIHNFVKMYGIDYENICIATDNDTYNKNGKRPGIDFADMMVAKFGTKKFLPKDPYKDWNEMLKGTLNLE